MHPEVEQEGPGPCPKCGMALESHAISLDEEENPEYDYIRKRFIFGAILTLPLVVIAMRDMLPGGHLIDNMAAAQTLGWLKLTAVVTADPMTEGAMHSLLPHGGHGGRRH